MSNPAQPAPADTVPTEPLPTVFSAELMARFAAVRATFSADAAEPERVPNLGHANITYAQGMADVYRDAAEELHAITSVHGRSDLSDLLTFVLFDGVKERAREARELTALAKFANAKGPA